MVESVDKAACEFFEGKISIDEVRERIENAVAADTYDNLMEIAKCIVEKLNKIDDYYVVSETEYNVLKATGQLEAEVGDTVFLGELSLDGSLRAVNGILPIVSGLKDFDTPITQL